jgi:hypothetical protein
MAHTTSFSHMNAFFLIWLLLSMRSSSILGVEVDELLDVHVINLHVINHQFVAHSNRLR